MALTEEEIQKAAYGDMDPNGPPICVVVDYFALARWAYDRACEHCAKGCDQLAEGAIANPDGSREWADGAFACRDACRNMKHLRDDNDQ